MKRVVLVTLLAVAALGLLVAFALKSRSVPVEVHVARHAISTELEQAQADFALLVDALQTAFAASGTVAETATLSRQRLAESPARLSGEIGRIPGSAAETARIENSLATFTQLVDAADLLAEDLVESVNEYAASVVLLRDTGPVVVQNMRDTAMSRAAAETFQLIVGTIDFAAPESSISEDDLRQLYTTLIRDRRVDANMSGDADRLLQAVITILDSKSIVGSKLAQLAGTPVAAGAGNLGLAVNDAYGSVTAAADSARLMLAVYAIVLLIAVGFIGYRLQASYSEINRANAELESLNESLEQRVRDRTRELSTALAELKESQVQLVQAEKMSSLGQLVAGISHEINTPLLYLANNAALINERIELLGEFVRKGIAAFSIDRSEYADHGDYQKKFIGALQELRQMVREAELEAAVDEARDLMSDSAEGLDDLTEMAQSLKDFSRLDRAPVGSFNVNTGIEKTLTIARNIVKHKAEVHKFFSDLPEIQCSPSKINQVFLNLITNAAQAIEEHGEIVIKTTLHDEKHVAIAISDTGCGISPANLKKICDPFFTTKEVGKGTGLGLSIVDEIVRSHGGKLLVESKLGEGSTFTVVLPIRQRAFAKTAPARSAVEFLDSAPPAADDAENLAEAV